MRCAGEGSKKLPSLGTVLGTVPKASQDEGAAVGSEVDSARFNSMDLKNSDVKRNARHDVRGTGLSPPTKATRSVGYQAFGSTDAAGVPKETLANRTAFARADQQQESTGDAPHAPGLSERMTSEDLLDTDPHALTTTTSPFGAQRESLTSRSQLSSNSVAESSTKRVFSLKGSDGKFLSILTWMVAVEAARIPWRCMSRMDNTAWHEVVETKETRSPNCWRLPRWSLTDAPG